MPHTQKSLHCQLILEIQDKSFWFNLSEQLRSSFSSSLLGNSVIPVLHFLLKVPHMASLKHVQLSHSWKFYGLFYHFHVTSSNVLLCCHTPTLPGQQSNFPLQKATALAPSSPQWSGCPWAQRETCNRRGHCTALQQTPAQTVLQISKAGFPDYFSSFWTTLIKQYFMWEWKSATNVTHTHDPRRCFNHLPEELLSST